MDLFESFSMAVQSISSAKGRSFLNMLGIIVGVMSVILLIAIGEGAQQFIVDQFSGLGSNLVAVTPGKFESRGGPPISAAAPEQLRLEDADALERLPSLAAVTPLIFANAEVARAGRSRSVFIVGSNELWPVIRDFGVSSGHFFSRSDVRAGRNYAAIGQKVRQELFGSVNPLGEMIKVGEVKFRIVAIMAPKGEQLGFDMDDLVFVPVSAAMVVFKTDKLNFIQGKSAGSTPEAIDASVRDIRHVLMQRHDNKEDFTIQTQKDTIDRMSEILEKITYMLFGLASVSLLVGGIGIMNIMLVSVKRRTLEIGLRKAVGASRRDILAQFLIEAMTISLTGGVVGFGASLLILFALVVGVPNLPVQLNVWNVALALGFTAAIGIAAGVYPAWTAAAKHPVEALRYE